MAATAIHNSADWFRRKTRAAEAEKSISFPELVAIRFRWQHEVRSKPPSERPEEFQQALATFKREHGEILEAHWCTNKHAAVALTQQKGDRVNRFIRGKQVLKLHVLTAEATKDAPVISAMLHRCQILSVRVDNVLCGMPAQIAMKRIVFAMGRLLTVVDVKDGAELPTEAPKGSERDVREIEQYYHRAAVKAARITFFRGMLLGIAGLVATSAAAWLCLAQAGWLGGKGDDARTVVLCAVMGAVGALVSLMSSGSGSRQLEGPDLDYELGRDTLKWMGSFRPFVGATFAVLLYFGIRSSILPIDLRTDQQTNDAFAVVAFLAGFSERWARGLVGGAQGSMAGRISTR